MAATQSPTVHQRRLRAELRKARENSSQTQEQVATALEWSLSKVIRIEAGTVGISTTDLRALLAHYGVADERITEIVALARSARERAWWSSYRKALSQPYTDMIGYESAASILRHFQPLVVPGLLQTSDYAEAITHGLLRPENRSRSEQLIEVRMRRQELLEQPDPPQFYFVIDEAVVHRHVGGQNVMRNQIRRLVELASLPHVTIEVVPFTAGAHMGLGGAFTIIEFPDPEDDDVLSLESERGSVTTRDLHDEVTHYREVFEDLRRVSLRPEGSAVLLSRLADEI
ncbi:XRE family transcriptional regulator [Actinomadura craniellae]|uniref:XRE family transcriptional regulator n=1 Tax=Actinomadura craniellae TaxID=2231787 RepID=A0A365H3V0_9ACTN|nr:helix-turn-helix transcriptional regulator [Actinomadura craniellae]RAY13662.1 XRE family transcriptional regulator [Actinomadura craniellae]